MRVGIALIGCNRSRISFVSLYGHKSFTSLCIKYLVSAAKELDHRVVSLSLFARIVYFLGM